MLLRAKWTTAVIAALFVLAIGLPSAVAQSEHSLSGIVKSIDKTTKTMVVKTADGTEQTIKYTEKTTVSAAKGAGDAAAKGGTDAYLAGKEGAKVTVKYTEEGGEKTAVGIKDAGKAVANNVPR